MDPIRLGSMAQAIPPDQILADPNQMEPQIAPLDKSRAREVAGKIEKEFELARERKRWIELRWIRYWQHTEGEYGAEWQGTEHDSDLFYKRTSQEVSRGQAKVLQLTQPIHGDPWDIVLSPNPQCAEGIDPKAALEGMRKKIRDALVDMDFDTNWTDASLHHAMYGTVVYRAPVLEDAKIPRLVRLGVYQNVKTMQVPKVKFLRVWDVYPDPDAAKKDDLGYVTIRHIMTKQQIRELGSADGFDADQIDAFLEENPSGTWTSEHWETALGWGRKEDRYIVFERWGYLDKTDQKKWNLDAPTNGIVQTWSAKGYLFKLKPSEFYDRPPFNFVPWSKRDGNLWAKGVPESMEDLQIILNSLMRAMQDNLAMTSGPNVVVDENSIVPGTKKEIVPRKIWPVRINELSGSKKPIDFFMIPSNINECMSAFQAFKAMIPESTGMPMLESPADAGSGMRTEGMMRMYYAAAEYFIKNVIGNVDKYLFEQVLTDLYEWFMYYDKDPSIKGDFKPIPLGVRGAMRREIIAQKAKELSVLLQNPEWQELANNPKLLLEILAGMGFDPDDALLTPDELAAKQQAMAMKTQMQASASENTPGAKLKAETSHRDALLQLATSIPDTNPAWAPAIAQAYEGMNAATPALYAALSMWVAKIAADYAAAMPAQAQNASLLAQGFAPQKPEDLDPDYREQQQPPALEGEMA